MICCCCCTLVSFFFFRKWYFYSPIKRDLDLYFSFSVIFLEVIEFTLLRFAHEQWSGQNFFHNFAKVTICYWWNIIFTWTYQLHHFKSAPITICHLSSSEIFCATRLIICTLTMLEILEDKLLYQRERAFELSWPLGLLVNQWILFWVTWNTFLKGPLFVVYFYKWTNSW